jgi:hypothetical protein
MLIDYRCYRLSPLVPSKKTQGFVANPHELSRVRFVSMEG